MTPPTTDQIAKMTGYAVIAQGYIQADTVSHSWKGCWAKWVEICDDQDVGNEEKWRASVRVVEIKAVN